jgi:hypothetical protein
MTEETPQTPRAEYHLQQFIKVTEPDERVVLLDEYDLLEPDEGPTPKGMADHYDTNREVEPDNRYEEIAVNEAEKHGLKVVRVDTIEAGPEAPDVKTQVELAVEYGDVVAEFHFVKERSQHLDLEPVTEDWYRQAVETIMRYNFDNDD